MFMPDLETERLVFKLYAPEDKENLVGLLTDERVMRHVGTGVLSRVDAEALWTRLIETFYPQGIDTIWSVFAREDYRYIGSAGIRPRPSKTEDWEITYILRAEEWGKGFATEIARKLIDFGFANLNLPEIYATVDEANAASIRVLEKIGMRFKGYDFDEQGRFAIYSINKN